MTREEAIKELKELEYYGRFFDNSETEDKKNKALFMAIEALEQEPCDDTISRQMVLEKAYKIAGYDRNAYVVDVADIEALPSVKPCGDAISRQAVRDTIFAECSGTKLDIDFAKVLILQRAIKVLPPVSVAEKTGHWIEERTYMECPNCHDIWHYDENQTERFKFCPTCGKGLNNESKYIRNRV